MKHAVTISRNKLKRYEAAEELCRAIRFMVVRPGDVRWPVTTDEMPVFASLVTKWVSLAGKNSWPLPKDWPS